MREVSGGAEGGVLERLGSIGRRALPRLARQREMLLAVALVLLALVAFTSLSIAGGLLGFAGFLAWCMFWPQGDGAVGSMGFELQPGYLAAQARGRAQMAVTFVESLPDPAIVLDNSGTVLVFNALANELFDAAETGRHLSQTTRAPDLLEAVDAARDSGQMQSCRLDFKVPVERSLTGTVTPFPNVLESSGTPALLIVLRDLSEQDLLIRMRADFVANASHELRTPLASLKGFVETLQHAAKDDPAARDKFLKIMQQQAERMARLIDDLLSLSRIEMHAHVLPKGQVELSGLLAHVVQTLQPIAQEKGITLSFASSAEGVVTGDRDELIQVFQNLIENAIKYGRTGGRVEVTSGVVGGDGSEQGRYVVAVADDGPGIAPEHLPRLTERFYRVNAAESRHIGGTGLGLAIAKHVVNRHRADLQIESTVGKGSTFRVVFPLPKRK